MRAVTGTRQLPPGYPAVSRRVSCPPPRDASGRRAAERPGGAAPSTPGDPRSANDGGQTLKIDAARIAAFLLLVPAVAAADGGRQVGAHLFVPALRFEPAF